MKKLGKIIRDTFEKYFSFEADIDLSNEVEVLFRRNVVIKNIILVSNLVYSLLLFVVTYGSNEPGSWLFTVVPFPLTYLMNRTIKKLIYTDTSNIVTQQVAMYLSSLYMFLSAIIIYMKLETGNTNFLSQSGYMLLYYSLIVVSLYQDRKMLKRVFSWMLFIVTSLHFFVTYQIYNQEYASSIWGFITEFPKTLEFRDILFRTVIMGCFMLVVYAICVIGEKMGEARTEELTKRQDIQGDFTKIVSNLFDVLINSRVTEQDTDSKTLSLVTWKLASTYGHPPIKCDELSKYALFLEDHQNDFKIEGKDNEDLFEVLRNQSELGTQLVKRIELSQKSLNIVRTHIEGNGTPSFINTMNKIQKNMDSDIILLSDIYITLRSAQSYKRPYPHKAAIESIKNEFYVYFDSNLLDRFVKFQSDFETLYDEN